MSVGQSNESADHAVRRLMQEQSGRLFALASRFCGNRAEAEDLVQEVFLNAYRGWDGFRGESSEATWLYRIAARACQRMHRKRSGESDRIASLDAELPFGDRLIAVIPSEVEEPVQRQIRAEARERLESAIAGLPDEFRVPVVLKEIVGFSVREVAEILGLEEGTVRSRVHRARLRLRSAVDSAVPRNSTPAPPPAYDERTCLDLLNAKQEALDRGVPFDGSVICDRCRAVFATLDLTQDLCQSIANEQLPDGLQARLLARLDRDGPMTPPVAPAKS